jgi:hypothetical protein
MPFYCKQGAKRSRAMIRTPRNQLLEAGYSALETDAEEIGCQILEFLVKVISEPSIIGRIPVALTLHQVASQLVEFPSIGFALEADSARVKL